MYIHYHENSFSAENPATKGFSKKFYNRKTPTVSSFLGDDCTMYIPTKVLSVLKVHVPLKKLRTVHRDKAVAIELCLMFLSNLANTYYLDENDGWKNLHTARLRSQLFLGGDLKVHKHIIDLLSDPNLTKNGPMIQVDNRFFSGVASRSYKLAERYSSKGVKKYTLTTEEVKHMRKRNLARLAEAAKDNVIANNLTELQGKIEVPTLEEVCQEAKKLVKSGHRDKKGRKLTFRHRNSDSHWTRIKASQRAFVEDHIKIYKRFLESGFMTPVVAGERAGGRVIDSLNLMPSWIRAMIKIKGERVQEVDYKALHPNIAMTLYGGKNEYISHDKVAEHLDIPKSEVKKLHLSFFNQEPDLMYHSPLYKYYKDTDGGMLYRLVNDKKDNGHKVTSEKMFKKEVEIMTSVIERLNKMGIFVGYVFDALFCQPVHRNIVKAVMNEEILKKGVKTFAE
jgi:hypothetical protein